MRPPFPLYPLSRAPPPDLTLLISFPPVPPTHPPTYSAPGKNRWSHVHVHSLASLYLSLLHLALSPSAPPPPKSGFSHYVLATNNGPPHYWAQLAQTIADLLVSKGELEDGKAVAKEGVRVTGTNSVGVSSNAKKLVGWTDEEKLADWVERDLGDVVRRFREGKSEIKENWGN